MKIRASYVSGFSLLVLYFIFLTGCKKESGEPNNGGNGVVTGIGTPDGQPVSGTIGPGGGSLMTLDGKLELIIPPGALSASTDITIQPITNNIPLGIAKAYRLSPDGLQFATSGQLIFHYDNSELDGTVPEAVFAAHQDENRIWQAHGRMAVDTATKKVTAPILHFSDWGFFTSFILDVEKAIVDPEEEVQIRILVVPNAGNFGTQDESQTLPIEDPQLPEDAMGIEIDQTNPLPASKGDISGSGGKATYTAPSSFPQNSYNIVKLIGSFRLSPNQLYHLTTEISLGGTLQFTVNGQSYFINTTCFATSLGGKYSLTGSSTSPMAAFSISWDGSGVGTYTSGGEGAPNDFGVETLDSNYNSSYFVPCSTTGEIKYLTCSINVTRANAEQQVLLGSFAGTLSVMFGTKNCGDYITDDYKEVELIGYYRVRWSKL